MTASILSQPVPATFVVLMVAIVVLGVGGLISVVAAQSVRWLFVVASAGILAVGAFIALGETDSLFASMHPLGNAGRGVRDIGGDPTKAVGIVDAWQAWVVDPTSRGAPAPIMPVVVAQWYVAIDSVVLVLSYSIALGTLFLRNAILLESGATEALAKGRGMDGATLGRFRTVGAFAFACFLLVPIFDLLENGLLIYFIERRIALCPGGTGCSSEDPSGSYIDVLTTITNAKGWLLLAAALGGLIVMALWVRLWRGEVSAWRPVLARVRAPFAVLVVFALLMWVNPQTEDLFRSWRWDRILLTVAVSIVAAYVTWSVGRRVTHATRAQTDSQSRHRRPIRLWVAAVVLAAVAGTGYGRLPGPRGLIVPAVAIAVMAWFERGNEDLDVDAPPIPSAGQDVVPAILAAAWPVLLAWFALKSIFPLTMYDHASNFLITALVFAFWAVLVPAAGLFLAGMFLRSVSDQPSPIADRLVPRTYRKVPLLPLALVASGVLLWVFIGIWPWATPRFLGGVGVVLVLFAALLALLGLATELAERIEPPALFRSLNVRRLPILWLIVIWLVAVSVIPPLGRDDYHDVRVLDSPSDASSIPTDAGGLFDRWIMQQPVSPPLAGSDRPVVPLMLIATDGGGIKAATWTTLVLDCLFSDQPVGTDACPDANDDRFRSVFAASGVSGGSVGLVTFTRRAIDPSVAPPVDDWIHEVLGDDFVSPSIAWQLFVEAPRSWLQFSTGMDRAEVLERGWEQAWPGGESSRASQGPLADGFRTLWMEYSSMPLLLLNGYTVQDGCKFVTTPIDGNGEESGTWNCLKPHEPIVSSDPEAPLPGFVSGSGTLTDVLCRGASDIRMSTAALLSARFPYASPSGRFAHCSEERAINVVDGGYGDNSGAGSTLELLRSIRPLIDLHNSDPGSQSCIVPVLLQIQNGYGPSPDVAAPRQGELAVPPKGIINAPTGITVWQRNAAQLAVLEPLPGTSEDPAVPAQQGVYALVHPFTHPGAEAPLGWTLSDEAEADLRVQLKAQANRDALQRIADFLDDPGTCTPAA